MSVSVPLGHLRLVHKPSGIEIRSLSTFTARLEGSASSSSSSSLAEQLVSTDSWVTSGRPFVLRLSLSSPLFESDGVTISQGLTVLRHALLDAKLWPKLNLAIADSSTPGHTSSSSRILAFEITPIPTTITPPTKSRNRIRRDALASDIRPPASIQSLVLDEVYISLDGPSTMILPDRSAGASQHLESEVWALEASDSDDDLFYGESNEHSIIEHPSSHPRKAKGAYRQGHGHSRNSESMYPLLALVDAALRLTVIHKCGRLHRGVSIVDDDRTYTLSQLAPAIWSQGYLKAMAERVYLLPTLSRVLSSWSGHVNGIPCHKSRAVPDIFARSSDRDFHHGTDVLEGIAVRLWKSLHIRTLANTSSFTLERLSGRTERTIEIGEEDEEDMLYADRSEDVNWGAGLDCNDARIIDYDALDNDSDASSIMDMDDWGQYASAESSQSSSGVDDAECMLF